VGQAIGLPDASKTGLQWHTTFGAIPSRREYCLRASRQLSRRLRAFATATASTIKSEAGFRAAAKATTQERRMNLHLLRL